MAGAHGGLAGARRCAGPRGRLRHARAVLLAALLAGCGERPPQTTPGDVVSRQADDDARATVPQPAAPAPPAGTGARTRAAASAPSAPAPAEPLALVLSIPVDGVAAADLHDTYAERRGDVAHEAIDIVAPRGTPVRAAGDGRVAKLHTSVPGGLTVYQFDPSGRYAYYYAHLDRYADGLREGAELRRGDPVGYVGSTGNASADTPHLHFALYALGPERQWWRGTPIDPYPFLTRGTPATGH